MPNTITWSLRHEARYAVGATAPEIVFSVKGLPEDPTGGTATFTATSLDGQTTVIDDAAATISAIASVTDEDTSEVTYSCTLTYDVSATLTATAGNFVGRFKLVFASAEVVFIPPGRSLTIEVIR